MEFAPTYPLGEFAVALAEGARLLMWAGLPLAILALLASYRVRKHLLRLPAGALAWVTLGFVVQIASLVFALPASGGIALELVRKGHFHWPGHKLFYLSFFATAILGLVAIPAWVHLRRRASDSPLLGLGLASPSGETVDSSESGP